MNVQEMINKYNIVLMPDNIIKASNVKGDAAIAELKAAKPEIVAILTAKKEAEDKAYADYEAKVDAIEGLKEIEILRGEWYNYESAFDRMMDTGSSVLSAKYPSTTLKDIYIKYPRAAAYLKAQSWHNASNYMKANAGRKAEEKILNGEDYLAAIAEMEKEFSDYCEQHVFD